MELWKKQIQLHLTTMKFLYVHGEWYSPGWDVGDCGSVEVGEVTLVAVERKGGKRSEIQTTVLLWCLLETHVFV